jgi:hypothetical protein
VMRGDELVSLCMPSHCICVHSPALVAPFLVRMAGWVLVTPLLFFQPMQYKFSGVCLFICTS